MGKASKGAWKRKVCPGARFTALARSVGLPAARHKTSFDKVKKEVAMELVRLYGGSFTSVDEFLLGFMPKPSNSHAGSHRKSKPRPQQAPALEDAQDIFLAVLDQQSAKPSMVPSEGYRHRTRIPEPKGRAHKDYTGQDFFKSAAWRQLRYLAISTYGSKCMCCGSTDRIHVDHIIPRSRAPRLELDIRNLQILCDDCNIGKGAWDAKDWRTDIQRLQAEVVHSKKGALR